MNHSPNPNWKPGDPIHSPVKKMVSVDLEKIDSTSAYKLLIGAVVPRPIAFVSTMNAQGIPNLAPFSFFNGVSSRPPAIMFSITRKSTGEKKDTLLNILETKEFVVNSVGEWMAEPMNFTSAEFPYGVDEMRKAGLTALPSIKVRPQRVKESAIQMECKLYNTMEVGTGGPGSATIVVGEIIMMHIDQRVYQDGKISIQDLQPIARLAGASYGRVREVFDLPRPILEKK